VACHRVPRPTVDCRLFPNGDPTKCELSDDGRPIPARGMLQSAEFGQNDLAMLAAAPNLYFVNRKGKTVPAFKFDNSADDFAEGFARTVARGKVGFVNADLDIVIAPGWDFASPFKNGIATVCSACKEVGDGEHTWMTGGKWGYINKRGKVVVPLVYNERTLPPPEVAAKQAGTVQ